MRAICILCWLGLLGACTASHAMRVGCDSRLRPINVPVPPAAGALAGAPTSRAQEGAP